jgi:hypothetical protein
MCCRMATRRAARGREMNHKRGRPKSRRSGCLLCKPNKLGQGMENKLGHFGFSKLRKEAVAKRDLVDATREF